MAAITFDTHKFAEHLEKSGLMRVRRRFTPTDTDPGNWPGLPVTTPGFRNNWTRA